MSIKKIISDLNGNFLNIILNLFSHFSDDGCLGLQSNFIAIESTLVGIDVVACFDTYLCTTSTRAVAHTDVYPYHVMSAFSSEWTIEMTHRILFVQNVNAFR